MGYQSAYAYNENDFHCAYMSNLAYKIAIKRDKGISEAKEDKSKDTTQSYVKSLFSNRMVLIDSYSKFYLVFLVYDTKAWKTMKPYQIKKDYFQSCMKMQKDFMGTK